MLGAHFCVGGYVLYVGSAANPDEIRLSCGSFASFREHAGMVGYGWRYWQRTGYWDTGTDERKCSPHSQARKSERGFSLLEMLFATVIFIGGPGGRCATRACIDSLEFPESQ